MTNGTIKEVSVHETNEAIKNSPLNVLIDVREIDEFAQVHAKAAVNVPLSTLEPAEVASHLKIGPEHTLYIICRSGARSMKAAHLFYHEGITKVVNVAGGTLAWCAAGLPSTP